MPSATIHLQVAYYLLYEPFVKCKEQFALGSVAPDSVNINGFAERDVRYTAHSRSLDLDEWKSNVVKIYQSYQNADDEQKSFGLGVCVHLLTDIFWDEYVQPIMFERISQEDKWSELYRYNTKMQGKQWYERMKQLLVKSQPCSYGIITEEMMRQYRDSVVYDYSDKMIDGECVVVSEQMVEDTAYRVRDFLRQIEQR